MNTYLKYKPAWLQLIIFGSLTFGIFFALLFVAIQVVGRVYHISATDLQEMDLSRKEILSAARVLQMAFTLAIFLIPSLVFAYLSDSRPMRYIGLRKPIPSSFFLIGIIIIIVAFPMVVWLSEVNHNMHLPGVFGQSEKILRDAEEAGNNRLKALLEMHSIGDLIRMLFLFAVLPAVSEEFFFRGVLQRLFIQITKRPWIGIIMIAIIFSALHGMFLGFIPRMVLGIILGALCWFSGSLWPGIIAHFIHNGLQIVLAYFDPSLAEKDPDFAVWMIAASSIGAGLLVWWMTKISQSSYAEVYDTDDDFPLGPGDQYIA